MITFLILLTLASVCLCFILGDEVLILLVFVSSVSLGLAINYTNSLRTRTPINPSIEIKCEGTICDTTYIYKIKE
jgi:hypothetical protein